MATYEVGYDAAQGVVRINLLDQVSDQDAQAMGTELLAAMREARRYSRAIRILMDNHKGVSLSSPALHTVINLVQSQLGPEDRSAVTVASSLMKAQARKEVQDGQEIFLSESSALTWLNAWK